MGQKKHRGNGQGTVYQDGKRFRGQVTLSNGKRRSKTFDTKKEANAWIRKTLQDDHDGVAAAREWNPEGYTVRTWFEKRLDEKVNGLDERPIKEQANRKYTTLLKKHVYPKIGDIKLQELTKAQLQDMYVQEYQGFSQSYINATVYLVKQLLKDAVLEGVMPNNPHDSLNIKFGKPATEIEAYNREEQQKIIDYLLNCKKFTDDIFYFLLSTGMRVGEACALTWDDIDYKNNEININKTAVRHDGGMVIQDKTKTSSGKRIIPLSSKLKVWLKEHEKKLDRDRNTKNLVFPSMHYRLFTNITLNQMWRKIQVIELDIPYKSIHALRHTFATRFLEEGIPVNVVSKLLGHSNPSTTMNVYQSVLPDLKRAAIEKTEHIF